MKQNKIVLHINKKSCVNCEMYGCCSNEGNVCGDWDISMDEFNNCVSKLSDQDKATINFNRAKGYEIIECCDEFSKYMNPPESE